VSINPGGRARGRRAGDVADVVSAGAARAEPEVLIASTMATASFGIDLAHLDLARGGDVGVAVGVALGEARESVERQGKNALAMRSRHI